MDKLIAEIEGCNLCAPFLEHGVNPVFSAHPKSKLIVIGQAPGSVVHRTGIPWNDKSGERLREWMGVDNYTFYDPETIGIIPMGFCYPGKGKSGDLPPRPECAPKWHTPLFNSMENPQLILLIGAYAQQYYLKERNKRTLTQTVEAYEEYLPKYFVLPHPSPRNNLWLRKNPWFELEVLPELKKKVSQCIYS